MYTLSIGCHRPGVTSSRDAEMPKTFETLEEAKREIGRARQFYKSIGYELWFATITDENGEEVYSQ